jgi:hypothetical protein
VDGLGVDLPDWAPSAGAFHLQATHAHMEEAPMISQSHFRSDFGDFSYLLASIRTREAIIVDPHRDALEAYATALESLELDLRYTLHTGGVKASREGADALERSWPCSSIVPADSNSNWDSMRAGHSDVIYLGDLEIECLGRPGLRNHQLAYRISDRVFTGAMCIRGEEAVLALPPETLVYRSCEVRGSHLGLLALEAGAGVYERERWREEKCARDVA